MPQNLPVKFIMPLIEKLVILIKGLIITILIISPAQAIRFNKIIAVTQIVSHPSLDQVQQGIIQRLSEYYHDEITINTSNASGSIVIASQLANKLIASKPDLIIAIATASAQTVLKANKGNKIPILFASVTDPAGAKLVDNLGKIDKNITGIRNRPPILEQLAITKQLLPNIKKLGVVMSMGEANSVYLLKELKRIALNFDIEIQEKSIINANEIKLAVESLNDKVEGFFLIQDNIVASGLSLFIKSVGNKPIISSYLEAVQHGALFGLAFDEYQIGVQTANMAIEVLEGQKLSQLPIEDPNQIELAINLQTAKKLNIRLPETLLKRSNRLF